jgi:hypothetical protein
MAAKSGNEACEHARPSGIHESSRCAIPMHGEQALLVKSIIALHSFTSALDIGRKSDNAIELASTINKVRVITISQSSNLQMCTYVC